MGEFLKWLLDNGYISKKDFMELNREISSIDVKKNTKEIGIMLGMFLTAERISIQVCDPFSLQVCEEATIKLKKILKAIGG